MPRTIYDIGSEDPGMLAGRSWRMHRVWGGELGLSPGASVRLQDVPLAALRISKSIWRGKGTYRRSVSTVRKVENGFYRIEFVDGGRLANGGSERMPDIVDGTFAVLDVDLAYHVEMIPDDGHELVVYTVMAPQHMLAPLIGARARLSTCITATEGSGSLAKTLIEKLFEEHERLSPEIRDQTIALMLSVVASCVRSDEPEEPQPAHLRRFAEVRRYVQENSADTNLSAGVVARQCHMSMRNLSLLLHRNGTNFSELLQSARVALARDLLEAERMNAYQVGEIATMCGFKTVSHFSRVFKQWEGLAPGAYRESTRRNSGARMADPHPRACLDRQSFLLVDE